MRIISGSLRGHRFHPPADKWPTRPTTDISKEGLYNILQNRIDFEAISMLDLFGGTGNHCFECISRGCRDTTYVDKYRPAIRFVRQQAAEWQIEDFIQIIAADVKKYIVQATRKYDYIFAGPPYPLPWLDKIPRMIALHDLLADDGLFVLEHNPDHQFEDDPWFVECRHYGQTRFSFFKKG